MQTTQIAKLTEQLANMARPQAPAAEPEVPNPTPTAEPPAEPQNMVTENTSKKNKEKKSKNPEVASIIQDKNDDKSAEEGMIETAPSNKATAPPTAPPKAKEYTKKISRADMVRQQKLSNLPVEVQEKFKKFAHALNSLGFKPTPRPPPRPQNQNGDAPQIKLKPRPVPVYLGGIPRGPIGKLRAMLRQCLPKWSVLNISFIGNSATELLCHDPLVDNLIADMKLLGYRHIPNYDPVREMNTDAATLRGRANCYQRWRWAAEN
ncbi:MAG: hypothetical protein AAGJ35_09155, partial [Myxococcota bacterium]